jgi:hypothetical protein
VLLVVFLRGSVEEVLGDSLESVLKEELEDSVVGVVEDEGRMASAVRRRRA